MSNQIIAVSNHSTTSSIHHRPPINPTPPHSKDNEHRADSAQSIDRGRWPVDRERPRTFAATKKDKTSRSKNIINHQYRYRLKKGTDIQREGKVVQYTASKKRICSQIQYTLRARVGARIFAPKPSECRSSRYLRDQCPRHLTFR